MRVIRSVNGARIGGFRILKNVGTVLWVHECDPVAKQLVDISLGLNYVCIHRMIKSVRTQPAIAILPMISGLIYQWVSQPVV